jgi:hypothetical protein
MRNRAKCKLCGDIIESFHPSDSVGCKCGEIAVSGGAALYTFANDYENFLRIDDCGNEIIVNYKERKNKIDSEKQADEPPQGSTIDDLINELDERVKYIENLPQHASASPVNHYEVAMFMLVISTILKKLTKMIKISDENTTRI